MKNATPNHENMALLKDESTTRHCNQMVAIILSNPPAIECSFTYEATL
jgi:hypothetical protein